MGKQAFAKHHQQSNSIIWAENIASRKVWLSSNCALDETESIPQKSLIFKLQNFFLGCNKLTGLCHEGIVLTTATTICKGEGQLLRRLHTSSLTSLRLSFHDTGLMHKQGLVDFISPAVTAYIKKEEKKTGKIIISESYIAAECTSSEP